MRRRAYSADRKTGTEAVMSSWLVLVLCGASVLVGYAAGVIATRGAWLEDEARRWDALADVARRRRREPKPERPPRHDWRYRPFDQDEDG
jgi:hypothetical protein